MRVKEGGGAGIMEVTGHPVFVQGGQKLDQGGDLRLAVDSFADSRPPVASRHPRRRSGSTQGW